MAARTLVARTIVAVFALTALIAPQPPGVADEPADLPVGTGTTIPWYDKEARTFHFGDTAIPSPAGPRVRDFRITETGILINDNYQRLIHLTPAGEAKVVLTGEFRWWTVRTGTYAGRQVAAAVTRSGTTFLEVRRIADSSLVRRTRVERFTPVYGLRNKLVWFGDTSYYDLRASTLNVATGRVATNVATKAGERFYVNVRLNVLGFTTSDPLTNGHIGIRPLRGGSGPSWTRSDFRVFTVSPDKKYVITAPFFDDELDSDDAFLQVRDYATGRLLFTTASFQAFEPYEGYPWEDHDSLLVNARHWPPDADLWDWQYVTVRLNMDGTMERVSGVGEQPAGDAISGPRILLPDPR